MQRMDNQAQEVKIKRLRIIGAVCVTVVLFIVWLLSLPTILKNNSKYTSPFGVVRQEHGQSAFSGLISDLKQAIKQ